MEKEVIDNDFTKRVASELVLKLKTIKKRRGYKDIFIEYN